MEHSDLLLKWQAIENVFPKQLCLHCKCCFLFACFIISLPKTSCADFSGNRLSTLVHCYCFVECALCQLVVWNCGQMVQSDGDGTGENQIQQQVAISFQKFTLSCSESTITAAFASSLSTICHWRFLPSCAAVDFTSVLIWGYQLVYTSTNCIAVDTLFTVSNLFPLVLSWWVLCYVMYLCRQKYSAKRLDPLKKKHDWDTLYIRGIKTQVE